MGDGEDRAVVRLQAVLEGVGALQVEVVGGLVQEEGGGPGQFQQEDLEAGLLAAGEAVEALLGLEGQFVAAEDRVGGAPVVGVLGPQDVEQGPPVQLGVGVGLGEVAGDDAGAEPPLAGVGDILPASSRRKWDLPEPLEPSTATRSP